MREIKIGQEVYLMPTGNIARYTKEIRKETVTKIGHKYFYTGKGRFEKKFDLKTLENINGDCNSAWVLFKSEQEIKDYKLKNHLLRELQKFFYTDGDYRRLTLEQLIEISNIVGIK